MLQWSCYGAKEEPHHRQSIKIWLVRVRRGFIVVRMGLPWGADDLSASCGVDWRDPSGGKYRRSCSSKVSLIGEGEGLLTGLRVVDWLCRRYTWQTAPERGLMRTRRRFSRIIFGSAGIS